jgi:hypothetical protein
MGLRRWRNLVPPAYQRGRLKSLGRSARTAGAVLRARCQQPPNWQQSAKGGIWTPSGVPRPPQRPNSFALSSCRLDMAILVRLLPSNREPDLAARENRFGAGFPKRSHRIPTVVSYVNSPSRLPEDGGMGSSSTSISSF